MELNFMHQLLDQKIEFLFPRRYKLPLASVNDLTVFKEVWSTKKIFFFGDKIYQNKEFFSDFEKEKNAVMMTPVKTVKGNCHDPRAKFELAK